MGRWIGMAIIALPLAAVLAGVTYGFEGFLRTPGQEGLATPGKGPQPRPVAAAPVKPEKPVVGVAKIRLKLNGNAHLDENSIVPVDEHTKLTNLEVKPMYHNAVISKERPLSVVFVIDNSLSMLTGPWGQGNDPNYDRLAATEAALKELKPDDHAAIVTFPRVRRLGQPYSMNEGRPSIFNAFVPPEELIPRVQDLRGREDGGTPLFAGAEMGLNLLSTEPEERVRVMVLITDGRQEPPMMVPSSLIEARQAFDCQVYGVTLGANTDARQMAPFADEIRQVSQSSDLVDVFRRVVQKSVNQLTGYDISAEFRRQGKPFQSGETIQIRALVAGRPRILEAEVP